MNRMIVGAAAALLLLACTSEAAAQAQPPSATFSFDWRGWTGWLPLELTADHHAYFHVVVNGRDAVGMIDPNLPRTAVDAAFASGIGPTAGGVQLDFPGLAIQGLHPTVSDFTPLKGSLGHPLDIILGSDAIDGVVADIDLLGRRISLNDEAGYIFPEIARYVRLVHEGDAWLAPVSIEGRPAALFAIDTTAGDDLQISLGYASELGLAPGRASLRQIKFAGAVTSDVTADVPRLASADAAAARGALGIGVLRCYRLMLDLQHDRLYTLVLDPGAAGPHVDWFALLRAGDAQERGRGTPF